MTNPNDSTYLLTRQYNTATNLNTRIEIHQRFSTNPYANNDRLGYPSNPSFSKLVDGFSFIFNKLYIFSIIELCHNIDVFSS